MSDIERAIAVLRERPALARMAQRPSITDIIAFALRRGTPIHGED